MPKELHAANTTEAKGSKEHGSTALRALTTYMAVEKVAQSLMRAYRHVWSVTGKEVP